MELDSVDRVVVVADSHDFCGVVGVAGPGRDEFGLEGFFGDDEAVVAGRLEGVRGGRRRRPGRRGGSSTFCRASDAWPAGPGGAVDLAHALVAETHTEDWDVAEVRPKCSMIRLGETRFRRRAGPGEITIRSRAGGRSRRS